MKRLLLISLPILAFASLAQARPSTYRMTCAQAKAHVDQNPQGVVMNYAYHEQAGHLYEMFYSSPYKCRGQSGMMSEAARVVTTDSKSCFVGYVCVPDTSR